MADEQNTASGVGTSPAFNAARQDMIDRVAKARTAGQSWDDINIAINKRMDVARQAGMQEPDINAAMGIRPGEDIMKVFQGQMQEPTGEGSPEGGQTVTDPGEAFMQKLRGSSGGIVSHLLAGTANPDKIIPDDAPRAVRLAGYAGELMGDIPAMMAGSMAGAAVGAPLGDIGGGAVSGAASFALPEAIKSTYAQAVTKGQVQGPQDFAERFMAVAWNTGKQAVLGALMGPAGKLAEAAAPEAGVVAKAVLRTGGELATLTAASAAMEKQLPSLDSVVDNALLLGAYHGVVHGPGFVHRTASNLMNDWAKTGQTPTEMTQQAANDPVMRQQLTVARPAEPETVAAEISTPQGNVVVPKVEEPPITVEAYHGTPYDISEFDTAKIGSGEGAQVFGHGLYFAQSKAISEFYQSSVTQRQMANVMDAPDMTNPLHVAMSAMRDANGDLDKAQASLLEQSLARDTTSEQKEILTQAAETIKEEMAKGNLYQVKLSITPDETIMHDEPMSKQSATVRGAFKNLLGPRYSDITAGQAYSLLRDTLIYPKGGEKISEFEASRQASEMLLMRGVKGIKYLDAGSRGDTENPTYNYVMFHNGDIEITHKNGTPVGEEAQPKLATEEAQRLVHGMFAVEKPESFLGRMKKNMWSIYAELFNPSYPINQMRNAFLNEGNKLDALTDPVILRRAADLSGGTSRYFIEKGAIDFTTREHIGPSLDEIFKPFEHESGLGSFQDYILSRRMMTEGLRDKKTGVALQAHIKNVQAGQEKYEGAFRQLMDWRNNTLAYARDAGMMSKADHDFLVKNGETMLPIYRQEREGALAHVQKGETAGAPKGDITRATTETGSDLPVLNIRANLMRDAFRRIQLADNNVANRAAMDLGQQMGVTVKISATKKGRKLTPEELDNIGAGAEGMGGGSADAPVMDALASVGWDFPSDTIPILRGGIPEGWRADDPALTQYVKGMDRQSMSTFSRVFLVPFAKFNRAGVVLSPFFAPKINLMYDPLWQFLSKPGLRNTVADVFRGMKEVLSNSGAEDHEAASYDAWQRSGGAEEAWSSVSRNEYIQAVIRGEDDPAYTSGIWNVINSPYRAMQAWSSAFSKFQRVGHFVRNVEAGMDVRAAGPISTDQAFHRAGFGGPAGKNMNAVHPFFLAHINGLEQAVRSMAGIGRTMEGTPYDAWQTHLKSALFVTLPVLGSYLAWKDEPWYKATPEWQKNAGIPTPWGFIPLPPIINTIYGVIPRLMMESYMNGKPPNASHILAALGESFLPPVGTLATANVFQPIIEKMANYSFIRGRPLNPSGPEDKDQPAERWTPWSSSAARSLSRFLSDAPLVNHLNLSPPEIDNFIQGWGGTVGTAAVQAAEQLLQASKVAKLNAPASRLSDLGAVASWTTRWPSATAQPIMDFNNRWTASEQVHGSMIRLMQSGDLARYSKLAAENPAAATIHHGAPTGLIGDQPEYGGYQQAMVRAQTEAMRDRVNLDKVVTTHRALDQTYKFEQIIRELPIDEPLSPTNQRTLGDIVKTFGAQPTGQISATDKRQILDMLYSTRQSIAEEGLKAMDKVGIK